MNRAGKTLTVFLIVISILLLSLTAISIFFYKTENELRKTTEAKLAQSKAAEAKLDADLKETKKQAFLLEEKLKAADDKINGLMEDLELKNGVQEQMKAENASLRDALAKENEEKEALHKELLEAQTKAASLESSLTDAEKLRADLEEKMKGIEQADQQSQIELERIVVTPGEIPEGRVVSINADNNFLIFNLGEEHGIKQDMVLSIYRADKYLGDIKTSRVQTGMSVADFIPPLTSKQVKKDDRVMAKK